MMARIRHISADTLGLIFISLALIILAIVTAWLQQPPLPDLSTYNYQTEGAAAVWHWLDENGIAVERDATEFYAVPDSANIAFVLQPSVPFEPLHVKELADWVYEGGVLFLVGDNITSTAIMGQLGAGLLLSTPFVDEVNLLANDLQQQLPIWQNPLLESVDVGNASAYLEVEDGDYVTLLAVENKPLVIMRGYGNGRFIFSSTPYPFTNVGIDKAQNDAFILNLINMAQREGTVWFDEWHHGFQQRGEEIRGPMMWLQRTPAGRAILFVCFLAFIVLALAGRAFGRAVPLQKSLQKRQAVEHVEAVASLHRRAGHVQNTLSQYRIEIKRTLGQRYRVDSALADEAFVKEIGRYAPDLDLPSIRQLLNDLQRHSVEDDRFVELAEQASALIESI